MLSPKQSLSRIRLVLWFVVLILALATVGATLGSILGYGFGIAAAVIVAGAHFILGRYIESKRKSPALLVIPTALAVLAPFLYFAVKIFLNGSLSLALLKGLLPTFIFGVLPVLLLLWAIRKIKQLEQQVA